MKKWIGVLVAAVICLGGCQAQKLESDNLPIDHSPEVSEMPRKDVSGNTIETGYADGRFLENRAGTLHLEKNGKKRLFVLSARAEEELVSLGIQPGERIVVNFEDMEDGRKMAVSLERILSE